MEERVLRLTERFSWGLLEGSVWVTWHCMLGHVGWLRLRAWKQLGPGRGASTAGSR